MNKNFIKKLVVTIIFITLLVIFFSVGNKIRKDNTNSLSVVKNIIREKYDRVLYNESDDYIYTLKQTNIFTYQIYDLNGNKLYKIESDKKLNIIKVSKNYYIVQNGKRELYNNENEKVLSSYDIEGLNDYLIRVDNKIIKYNGEVLFDNINTVLSYDYNNYFCLNNYYLIDKKGKVILDNTSVIEEINNKNKFFIIRRDNKYYTFYLNIDTILGESFKYYINKEFVYIDTGKAKYKILPSGFRKKIKNEEYNKIDKEIVFSNNYKTKKIDNNYLLFDKNNKVVLTLDKQIVLENIKIKNGFIDNDFYLLNLDKNEYKLLNKVIINKEIYYISKEDKTIYDKNLKMKYKSNNFLIVSKKDIIYEDNNIINTINLEKNKIYNYDINNKTILGVFKNSIIIKNNEEIEFINFKGEIIKKIKCSKIKSYYYHKKTNTYIIITIKEENGSIYEGSYVAE